MAANTPAQNSETLSWRVEGMDCASCAAKIRSAVERMPGVSDAKLSVMSETLTLRLDARQSAAGDIERQITKLGYKATPLPEVTQQAPAPDAGSHAHDHGKDHKAHVHGPNCDHDHFGHDSPTADSAMAAAPKKAGADTGHGLPGHVHEETPAGVSWWQTGKGRLVIGTGALLAGAWLMKYIAPPQVSHWAFIIACIIGVIPVARRAFAALAAGIPFTIEMLMTIAAAGALVIGAAEEAALVVFLFAVGEVLEGVAAQKARASIKALGDLVPKTAWLESNGPADGSNRSIGQSRPDYSGAAGRPHRR